MSAWHALDALLITDLRDAGCDETFELVHAYAEIVLSGGEPEVETRGVAVHLARCLPCSEDYIGLLAALRRDLEAL